METKSDETFVLLGGTGDLARKKLLPSLFNLYKKGKLGDFDVIGTSRHDLSREEYVRHVGVNINKDETWDEFKENIRFARLNFYNPEGYEVLQKKLLGCGDQRLFYLATLPQHFDVITDNLAALDLVNETSKVLYEKPFGEDLRSAKKLNRTINELFPEENIYRIDHYLDKELVGNLSILRFSNSIIEPIMNAEYVDQIQIIASEDFGVGERGGFYDRYGAVKDFFQSHLLQLLSLVGMSTPEKLDAKCIRDEKVRVLQGVSIMDTMTGQYEGYRDEEGVDEDSTTETLAAVKASLDGPRWQGVPFYILTGKNLAKKYSQIYIQFDKNNQSAMAGDGTIPNSLVVSIQPDRGIYLVINTKVPGGMQTEPAKMEFCHACHHGPNTPSAYENLLAQALAGDQRSFIRYDEIEEQWRIVDGMKLPEPTIYKPGKVPPEVHNFIQDGEWHGLS
ncbi:MAG: glucose-6-phosphate dehydrogenase [Candidatus Bipolaricaulota bacterium]|nr:glucose-6-phosphate dehydrogenase [Candidatus Bipolaricaulota bacterium]MBS3791399.1 glucose-6-phosphate dehydrogenase [Candidatus Bipolaricaulota bacterium]